MYFCVFSECIVVFGTGIDQWYDNYVVVLTPPVIPQYSTGFDSLAGWAEVGG